MKIIILLLLVSLPTLVGAENSEQNTKKTIYQKALVEYKAQAENGLSEELLPYAKALYFAGQDFLDKDDNSLAVLAQNYAATLNIGYPSKDSISVLQFAINSFENAKEPQTERLIEALFNLGKVYNAHQKYAKRAKRKFNQAVELAEQSGDDILLAQTLLKIGVNYISGQRVDKRSVSKAIDQLETSYKKFSEQSDERANIAAFWLGKANIMLSKSDQAIKYFSAVLDHPFETETSSKLQMSSHAFLVRAYTENNEPEKATVHCQAIGESTPWNADAEASPIYLLQPNYPKTAQRNNKSGWVKTKFTIDSNGFAKDIRVVGYQGHSSFSKEALRVIKEWRFAPKFEKGKPVDATSVYTIQFKLSK